MLLGHLAKALFPTASVRPGKSLTEHIESASPPKSGREAEIAVSPRRASNERVRLRLVSFDEQEMDEARHRVATASYVGALELVFEIERYLFEGMGWRVSKESALFQKWPIDRQSIPRLSARPLIV
jgi:hypothetical protein